MPSRTVTLMIFAFWLGMTVWLMQSEIWPRLQPGQPPAFTLDLMDDSQLMPFPIRWAATHTYGGSDEKTAEYFIWTSVAHHSEDDSFDLTSRLEARRGGQLADEVLLLRKLETVYRLERDGRTGRMSSLGATLTYRLGPIDRIERVMEFAGEVEGDVCRLRLEGDQPGRIVEVGVSRMGTVLLPLHPVQRIEGLRPGQRWGCYLFDPLVSAAHSEPQATWVNARVRSDKETLRWHTRDRVCLVIDYEGGGRAIACSTWVDAEDGRVLQMTVRLGDGDRWEITRE